MVMVAVELSQHMEEKARRAGLLSGPRLAALIEAELEREGQQAAAGRFLTMSDALAGSFRETYGNLSDDEAQAMIDGWIEC